MTFTLPSGEHIKIDARDFGLLSYPWNRHDTGGGFYVSCLVNGRRIYLHRLIAHSLRIQKTHHKDGDWTNCERENLVACTNAENLSGFRKRSTRYPSKFRGVGFYKRDQCWRAQIMSNYKQRFLGYFGTEAAAARAYDRAAKVLFGKFAQLNFPD